MTEQKLTLAVSPTIGTVSAEVKMPVPVKAMLTLAHGAGAGMQHTFMVALAQRLATRNIGTLRFNFPFIEQKKKRPDLAPVAHRAVATAIETASAMFPRIPLFAGGKSFGGRMTSQWLSQHPNRNIRGIVFFGFPLHPPNSPSVTRADHLAAIEQPLLFLQGTRDALARWDLMSNVTSELPAATLVKLEGADHAFKGGRTDFLTVLAEETEKWMQTLIEQ
jgi:hypothetical protein